MRLRGLSAVAIAVPVAVGAIWSVLAAAADPPAVRFLAPAMFDSGEAMPADVERADLNNDGIQDLAVVTTQGGGKIQILLGDGLGGLHKDNTVVVPYASGIASGDLNGDGILDLAVTQTSNKTAADGFCGLRSGTVILLGSGGATPGFAFKSCVEPAQGRYLTDAVLADFDGDGRADLVAADDKYYGASFYHGLGDGTFTVPGRRAINGNGLHVFGPLTATDANRDGHLDVTASVSGVGIFFGDGGGGLAFSSIGAGSAQLYQHLGVRSFAVGDINRDGIADIVGIERGTLPATPATPQNFFFASLGTGDGISYWSSDTHPFTDGTVGSVLLADFNKDQALDAVAVDRTGNRVRVYLGQATGVFVDGPVVAVGTDPQYAVESDWNSDNWRDLAIVDRNQGNQSRTWVLQQVPGAADATPPTVALTAPGAGVTLQGTVTLAATAGDANGISRVDFYRDSTFIASDSTSPYSVAWNTATTANGPVTLTARAVDLADNVGTSSGVAVTVANADTTPPVVALTSPAAGTMLSGVVSLLASATDANGVTRIEFFVGTTLAGSDTAIPPSGITWNSAVVAPGTYQVTARAYDAAGNAGTSAPVQVTIDQLPVATATGPATAEASSPAGATITLSGSATDPDASDLLTYLWTEEGVVLGTTPTLTLTRPLGIRAFAFRVTDRAGAFATAYVQVSIEDTRGPVLSLPAPIIATATSASGAAVTYAATATDLVSGPVAVTCAPASGSQFPIGTSTVSCSAADGLGNTSSGAFTVAVTTALKDAIPPVLYLPSTITAVTRDDSAIVTFTATAIDDVSGSVPVTCSPPSGWSFKEGNTTVSCSAVDAAGNTATGSFQVRVRHP